MHIVLSPIAGDLVVNARIEAAGLTINNNIYAWDALPKDGPVRADGDIVTIDYGEHGGVSTCQLTGAHTVEVIVPDLPPPPAPKVDLEAMALAGLETQRQGWVADRWQVKTVLGRGRWLTIEDFGARDEAPWGLKTVIEDAVRIPRVSQTVDLLAHILGMSDEEVDDLFRAAMTLNA